MSSLPTRFCLLFSCLTFTLTTGVSASTQAPDLCHTSAFDSPLFLEDMEATPLGQLPTGWSFSGTGSAGVVNTQNFSPGGAQSVNLLVNPGASAKISITFSPSITGTALALNTPSSFGKSGLLVTRYWGTWGGVPNTLLAENTVDLLTGFVSVTYPGIGGTPSGFTFSGSDIDNWRTDDLDVFYVTAGPSMPECWGNASSSFWCACDVPPEPSTLEVMEVELISTGIDSLSVFLDDFRSYDQQITTFCPLDLTISGACPGVISLNLSGATPFGGVAVAFGSAGAFTIPGGRCAGITLDISNPTVALITFADSSGMVNLNPTLPAGLCGLTVQFVDLSSCLPSNPVIL